MPEANFGAIPKPQEVQPPQEQAALEDIKQKAEQLREQINGWRNAIHENPELGGEERQTAQIVEAQLNSLENVEIIETGIGGAGILARIEGAPSEPTIILRADMDALPITENPNNSPCSQKEGAMHACGHDAHTAGLLGAAAILSDMAKQGQLPGNVILIFQSNEERLDPKKKSGGGEMAKALSRLSTGRTKTIEEREERGKAQAPENPERKKRAREDLARENIAGIIALHVDPSLKRGEIRIGPDTRMTKVDRITIYVESAGGHIGYAPEIFGPVDFLAAVNVALKKFRPLYASEKALVESPTMTIPTVPDSVVPSEASSAISARIVEPDRKFARSLKDQIEEQINQIFSQQIQEVNQTRQNYGKPALKLLSREEYEAKKNKTRELAENEVYLNIKKYTGARPVVNPPEESEVLKLTINTLKNIFGDSFRQVENFEFFGEDVSYLFEWLRGAKDLTPAKSRDKGIFMMVGASDPNNGIPPSNLHSPDMRLDAGAITDLTAINCALALELMNYYKNKLNKKTG